MVFTAGIQPTHVASAAKPVKQLVYVSMTKSQSNPGFPPKKAKA
jgi:hypothetical protein